MIKFIVEIILFSFLYLDCISGTIYSYTTHNTLATFPYLTHTFHLHFFLHISHQTFSLYSHPTLNLQNTAHVHDPKFSYRTPQSTFQYISHHSPVCSCTTHIPGLTFHNILLISLANLFWRPLSYFSYTTHPPPTFHIILTHTHFSYTT